jgi:eukaryotic-like serine/threonine-protein kinase
VISSGSPAGSGGGPAAARDGIADYQFIRMLGAGNHGVYYLAGRPERLGPGAELVAVKVLSGASSQDTFRRATRELAAFAAVSSPDLVTLYDAGQQGEELYYSMEYFPGGSLADPAQPPPDQAALAAVAGAARAAHALHEAGIVHNDIKPGNVMLPEEGGGKLADLGLSRVLTPGMTVSGLGSTASVEYLDPAVLRGQAPSRASDIFALGATLHRALAGEGLYGELPGDNALVAMRRVLSRQPVVSGTLDPAARDLVSDAISEDSARRPVTAQELAGRVEALAA